MPLTIEVLPDTAARDRRLVELTLDRASPLDRLNLLIGSGLQRWSVQRSLAEAHGGALAGIYGFTPVDLAQAIARLGDPPERQSWPLGADLAAVERLLETLPLTQWRPDAPGLGSAMLRTLTDLREAQLSPTDLPVGDLRLVYEAWRDVVRSAADRTSSYEDAVAATTTEAAIREALGGAPLIVSGIYDLTRIQRGMLARVADAVEVRMLLVDPGIEHDSPPRRTMAALQRECGASVERPRVSAAALPSEHYFSVGDPTSEADEISSRVLDLAAQGVPFHRIAILHQQGGSGDDRLCAALKRAGVGSWRIGGQRLSQTPLGQSMLALARMLLLPETVEREALLDWLAHRTLRNRPLEIERRPGDWEQIALSLGLHRGLHEMAAAVSDEDDGGLAQLLADLSQRSRALADCGAWGDAVELLLDACDAYFDEPAEDRWQHAAREAIGGLRLHDQLGVAWQPRTAETALTRSLSSRVVREPGSLAHVHVGAATGPARGIGYEAIFVAAAAERILPAVGRQDPLLTDDARVEINRRIPDALALQRDRAVSDRHAWTLARHSAARQFTASWSRRTSAVGSPTRASSLLLESATEIERIASSVTPFAPSASESEADSWDRVLRAPDERSFQLAVLNAPGVDVASVLPELWPQAEAAATARRLRNAARFTEFDGRLTESFADLEWSPLERVWSAGELETFVTCPYRFYLLHVLSVGATPTLNPSEQQEQALGGAIREILDEWQRAFLASDRADWASFASDAGRLRELAQRWLDDERSPRLLGRQESDAILRAVERHRVREAADAREGWRPLEANVDVASASLRVSGGRTLLLRARVDRIDVHQDGKHRAVQWFDGAQLPSVRGFVNGSSFASLAAFAALSHRGVKIRNAVVEHRALTEQGSFARERILGESLATSGGAGAPTDGDRLQATLALLADQLEMANFVPNPGQPTRERPNCQRCPVEPACSADLARRYEFKSRRDPDAVRAMEALRRQPA